MISIFNIFLILTVDYSQAVPIDDFTNFTTIYYATDDSIFELRNVFAR